MSARSVTAIRAATVLFLLSNIDTPLLAQEEAPRRASAPASGTSAWFGLPLPPTPGSSPAVVVGTRGPRLVHASAR